MSAIGLSPSVMINRIATNEGASVNSMLAQVAKLRGEMALAHQKSAPETTPDYVKNPLNGAEVDLLV